MPGLWCITGREPLLSLAELTALFGRDRCQPKGTIVHINTADDTPPEQLMQKLGGTIKIAYEAGQTLNEAGLLTTMQHELQAIEGKIHFGISFYPLSYGANRAAAELAGKWGKMLKQRLKEKDRSVRHVYNREAILSSVTVEKNGLTKRGREFVVAEVGNGAYDLACTKAVQPFEAFSRRDFGRPGRDDVSGMLPPKLAMMMINYAAIKKDEVLYDPFCGSGTILSEAMLMGYRKLLGSDNSSRAVADSMRNIDWVRSVFSVPPEQSALTIFTADATKLGGTVADSTIQAIVTEPYLGKPLKGSEPKTELERQAQELGNLYVAAFQEFFRILSPAGRVIFITPCFRYGQTWIRIPCSERIQKIGFRVKPLLDERDYLLYSRPDQRVGREIWQFEKNN